jgi:hypothetical protein
VRLLILKLILSPALIAAVTLAARRWGPGVGGWLTGMPMVAGPTLFFIALEQGDAFAARAAGATLISLIAVAAFALAYARACVVAAWPLSLLAGLSAFGVSAAALHAISWILGTALLASVASYAIAARLVPTARGRPGSGTTRLWDLPLRMASAIALIVTVTHFAAQLGPTLSGALTPFPVALAILAVFTHAQQGAASAVRFIRAFLPAMWSFSLFCFAVAVALVPLGHALGFAVALGLQLAAHALVLWWLRARSTAGASSPPRRWTWRWRRPSA